MRKLALVLVLAAAAACKQKEEPAPRPPPKEPTDEVNMSGERPRKMANCPSAVPGATTTIERSTDGVIVTVTARDPDAARKIAELATLQGTPTFTAGAPHTGTRSGTARIGYCPTVYGGVRSSVKGVDGGVRVQLSAETRERVEELQRVTEARARRLPGFTSS